MKNSLILIAIIFATFFIFNNWDLAPEELKRKTENVGFPFELARLSIQKPEEKIAIPIRTVRVNQIADTWQAPRSGERLHEGQDIFAPRGTAVYSATNGYVVRIGENSLGGKTISVYGAGGRVYYYAHLNNYASDLVVGDLVTPETIVGYVGTTGNARGTPPHLHFGVYTSAGPINPLPLLEK